MPRLYPKSKVRKTIKTAARGITVPAKITSLIYLDYMLFLERLLQQADIEASKMGDKKITRRHIDATFTDVLKEFRG